MAFFLKKSPMAIGAAVAAAVGMALALPSQAATPEQTTSFQKRVLPIFQEHCSMCHSPGGVGYISVSFDLSSYQSLRSGSAGGIAIVPYHPDRSPLMKVLKDDWTSHDKNALRMPPLGPPLSQEELGAISQWIKEGAKDN